MSPYLGYVIMHDKYELALGLLFVAGISDLVSIEIFNNLLLLSWANIPVTQIDVVMIAK